jgi:hypothetical protein
MTTRRRFPTALLGLALGVLPSGSVRERYRRELIAELSSLPPERQLRHSLGFLVSAWSLRRAVTGRDALVDGAALVFPRPLHCRLHLYHHYRLATTDDGGRYLRCRDCGLDRPGTGNGPADIGTSGVVVFRDSL